MLNHQKDQLKLKVKNGLGAVLGLAIGLALFCASLPLAAQGQTPAPQTPATQTPDNGKPKQDVPDEAGGPTDSVGPYAIPKKKADDAPPPPPPPVTPKRAEDIHDYSLKVNVPLVNVDVSVTSKDGQFIPGLKQENFRVLEDGVPQPITSFGQTQAPITAVLLIEFANSNYTMAFLADALRAAYAFADGLKKDDWGAVIEYDMKPNILLD